MKNAFALSILAVVFVASAVGAARAATAPPAAILAPINAAVTAVNSGNPSGANGLYTNDAVVVDEFAPFSWTGINAGSEWISTLNAMSAQAHITNVHGVLSPPSAFSVAGDSAYLSFPTDVHFTLNGKNMVEHGTFAFTLRNEGGAWKIVTQTWGTLRSAA